MNKNLISLDELFNIIKKKKLDKYITSYGYSKKKDKKYYVILNNGNVIHFGNINYEDYLIHNDNKRRQLFRKRFKLLYEKNKDNVNSSLFWSWNLLW